MRLFAVPRPARTSPLSVPAPKLTPGIAGVASAEIPKWADSNYDSVYILQFAPGVGGRPPVLLSFQASAQNFSYPGAHR